MGDQNHLRLEIKGHNLTTLTDPHSPWKAGDAVSVELVDPLYFDATGARVEAR